MDKIRCAIVGCGRIGKRHAAIVDGHPDCELVALCDAAPKVELDLEQWSQLPFYHSIEQLLVQEPEVEVVHICTPNGLHAEQALKALDARRHVVVEKPMALHKVDCERIIHRALNVGKQVFCVMQNRYSPPMRWLKEQLEAGTLGDLYLVQVNAFWNRDEGYYQVPDGCPHPWHGDPKLDGGVLFTQFAHFVDLLFWLFGDLDIRQVIMDHLRRPPAASFPDSGNVQFRLSGNALGSFTFSTAVWQRNFESSLRILGSKGTIGIAGQYMNILQYCDLDGVPMPELPEAAPPNDYGPYQGSAANHHFVIQNMVEVLQGKQEVGTNALEGMKVVEIIERIHAAGLP